jgi:hypothetical protein
VSIGELRSELARLQPLLGLTEWQIRVQWGKPSERPDYSKGEMDAGSVGNACWHTEECRAWIYLRRGSDNLRETLIHELLHVRLEGHRENPMRYDALYERALNAIAAALAK